MLRVIAGEHGGRRLRAPTGLHTRPTADRVREALFNILPAPSADSVALDLYAGSGALGIEALSRGAAAAVFVDADATACRVLRDNLRALGLLSRSQILQQRVEQVLPRLQAPGPAPGIAAPPFAYVFIDPPYKDVPRALPVLLRYFAEHAAVLLEPRGILVVEHDRRDALPAVAPLRCCDARRYGDTALSFYSALLADRLPPDTILGDSH
jgi:16S rRNA (guanine966-N2)-methyltransferase